jgi:type IV secretion system protein VirB4
MIGAQLREQFTFTDKPADEYLTFDHHISDDTVILADGSHVAVLKVEGKPLTLMDTFMRYGERRRRHGAMRALADTNVELYEHHVCHDRVDEFVLGEFRSDFSRELAQAYHEDINSYRENGVSKKLMNREWLITILVRPRPFDRILNKVFGSTLEADELLVRQVDERARTLIAMLREYNITRLGVRVENGVPYSEIGEAMRLVLYGRWRPVPMTIGTMAGSIYTDRVICGMRGFEVVGSGPSSFGMMFGFRDYPEVARPEILDGIFRSQNRIVMTNSFIYRSAGAASDRMSLKQRRMSNAGDKSLSLQVGLNDAMDDVQSGRAVMGDHHWSLAVHADSVKDLENAVGEIKSLLSNTSNLPVTNESIGCFPAYWSQMPGSPDVMKARHGDVKLINHCSFSSMGGFPKGSKKPHWGRPAIRLRTDGNTAHDFDPFCRRVGHAFGIGPTGFGKTTTLGLFDICLEQNLVPRGGLSVIFDKDASNELSVLARGGYYVRIRRGMDSGMVPLKGTPDTEDGRSYLGEFVKGLIMDDGKGEPPADQVERIRFGIAFVMRLPKDLRSLGGLRQFLDHGNDSTGARLERWCRGGALGWAFDGEQDTIRLDSGVVGIDNTEILPDDMISVRAPAASYQLFRVKEKVGRGVRAAVFIDEAASYLPDERFAAGFDAFSRELRKGNGLLWMMIHHPQDFSDHPRGRAILANCPTKLLFPNPYANETVYRDVLKCTPGEIKAVVEDMLEMGDGTFLVKRPKGTFIAKAQIRRQEFISVLSSDPLRSALWHRICREKETNDPNVIWAEFRNRYQEAAA